MRIAILTSGILPVPAVQGGAVENLIDFYLEYNDRNHLHDITVYSIYHPEIRNHLALQSKVNHYRYIDVTSFAAKIRKHIFKRFGEQDRYYHYSVEYFLEQSLKHISKQSFDIVIVENRPGYVLKLKHTTSAKLIIHQENDYLNTKVHQYQQIYDTSSCIINTSDYITKCVQNITSNDTKCKTVLNGIDTKRFYEAKPLLREQVGLKSSDFVIVFSGRLTKEKGILELVKAIRKLSDIPCLKLLIIGARFYGQDKVPTPFIRNLKEETHEIQKQVLFTGYVDYRDVPAHLKVADIAVLPSVWEEPFGLTCVEALAAGLPLITTRSGGIPEICEGVATIVDRENLVDNLASAILDLYQHPEKCKAMSQAGIERSKMFDKETYARNFFKALEP